MTVDTSRPLRPGEDGLPTEADVDVLLANDLNALSFKERDYVYEEIHGVSEAIVETEELVQRSLAEMEEEIENIPDKPDYEEAIRRCRSYVEDRRFRLLFLRARRFDTKEAAAHLVRYFKGKRELFGDSCLCRRVTLSDLDDDDRKCLTSGVYQLIPGRDRADRPVICDFMGLLPKGSYKRTENMLKSYAFIMMSLVEEDERCQKNGMCGIVYLMGSMKLNEMDGDLNRRTPLLAEWVPVRCSSVHLCSNNQFIKAFKSFILAAMIKTMRVRCRIHNGSVTEIQYELMSFGVPIDSFPVSPDGVVKTNGHCKWIARQAYKEQFLMQQFGSLEYPHFYSFPCVEMPSNCDVLLGRGKSLQYHPGNVKMRQLCGELLHDYKYLSKVEKEKLYERLVSLMNKSGGRFLRREKNGWWSIASDEEAIRRAETVFRVARNAQRPTMCKEISSALKTESNTNKRAKLLKDHDGPRLFKGCCGFEEVSSGFTKGLSTF